MPAQYIGQVKSGRTNKSYEVKWDSLSREVYVSYAGWSYVEKASSASHAMNMAESWLYEK